MLTGTGGVGTYTLDTSQTVSSTAITGSSLAYPDTYNGNYYDKDYLRSSLFDKLVTWSNQFGFRVFVNEFGAQYSCPDAQREQWHADMIALCEEIGADWLVHAYGFGSDLASPLFNWAYQTNAAGASGLSPDNNEPSGIHYRKSTTLNGNNPSVGPWTTGTQTVPLPLWPGRQTVVGTSTGESFTDDGAGNLIGSAGGTGSVDYSTGAISVTFNASETGATATVFTAATPSPLRPLLRGWARNIGPYSKRLGRLSGAQL